jgi:hypothetical protein
MNGTFNQPKTYVIEYDLILQGGASYPHKTKVKNCMSELHAKVKLKDYLKNKHKDFKSINIISCHDDYMGIFGDIFSSNPFGFGK